MSHQDPAQLYQQVVVEHNRSPRNHRVPAPCSHRAHGHNPLCGDEVILFLRVVEDRIVDAGFQGESCAIATASASLLTEAVIGRTVSEAQTLLGAVNAIITGAGGPDGQDVAGTQLQVLGNVRRYPGRQKCATLPWATLAAALADSGAAATVTTEAASVATAGR